MRLTAVCLLLGICLSAQGMRARIHVPARWHGAGAPALSTPQISQVTQTGFTITWTTSQPLNTQLRYGAGTLTESAETWALTTSHSVTVTGLQPGTAYQVQAESAYDTQVDLEAAVQTVTTTGTPVTTTPPPASAARLFPAPAADWLYAPPTGTGLNISGVTSKMGFYLNTHDGGFDFPVAYTDATHGCTTFTDTLVYNLKDKICVPNPPNGYWPSTGGWGADDGHLVIVDTATNNYYGFWKLYVNTQGQPTSTNVGKLVEGSLNGSGNPGTTAAEITGLAGDILPGELDCVTCLNHALNVVVPVTMNAPQKGDQGPITSSDGTVAGAVFREGAKIRFDPSVDVSTLNASTAVKAILRALQLYGGLITDQTGADGILFYTDLPTQPDTTGINLIGQHLFIYY
ncbi:MAG: fibronectin type III domain-containing protein [Terriglobales bacterium]